MATFKYSARDGSGRVVAGAIDAASEVAVVAKLQEMGFYVTSLEEETQRAGVRSLLGRLRGISLRDLTILFRQFSTMVSSGLSMLRTLSVLEVQTENPKLRQIVSDLRTDVQEGKSLSEATARHPQTFSNLVISMIRAGEIGGVLDEILQRVATFLEKDLGLRQKVRAAVTYPIAIFIFAIGIIIFLVFFILPQFIGFFEGLDLVLPAPTRMLIWFTHVVTSYWYVIVGLIVGGLLLLRRYIRTPAGRMRFDRFKLRVPIFGPLVHKVTISRFSRTFATLISSGVPIMQALEVVAGAVDNKVLTRAIEEVRTSIREGESIALPLQASGIFPPMVVQMTSVGEETGQLDGMLTKVADFYDAEVETTLAQLTSIIEPLLILFLGFVVGFIVLSFYLPLYTLITGIK
jgi:type IV pilus assembly protein PilC